MTIRALLVALLALPVAAVAQVGSSQASPAPADSTVQPPPPPELAAPQAVPPQPPPELAAPQAVPPLPPDTAAPQAAPQAAPPPPTVTPPSTPAPAPAPVAAAAPAPVPAQAGPARQSRESTWRASASIGAGSSYGNTYFLVGARIGRELAAGLALEVDGQYWAGESPSLGKIAPGITWYAPFRAYIGAYYARWFVGSGFPDQNAVGARAGYTMISRGRTFAGVGVAYERVLDCSRDCESWWPEASVGVSF
jgi:hypothetical protein